MTYRTIVVDPPWNYTFGARNSEAPKPGWNGNAANHYATMSYADLVALPVAEWAGEDCLLWLWSVNAMPAKALGLLEAWGFLYLSALTWVKTTKDYRAPAFGAGYWLRGATEHALLARRGSPTRQVADQPSWFWAPPQGHSVKPDAFYRIAERMGMGPRLDVFARTHRDGWDVYGNQAEAHSQMRLIEGLT